MTLTYFDNSFPHLVEEYYLLKIPKESTPFKSTIALKDLMYMCDYYDRSHFFKDFKLFMNETPQSYFK